MPRCRRLRTFICEYKESPKLEKISFIPPFLILALEIILVIHALILQETYVIIVTLILLVISIIEIIFVTTEIHEHYQKCNFDRELTIRLDDFIIERNAGDIKKTIDEFIDANPDYEIYKNEIYPIAYKIMQTHKIELWEKTLEIRLKKFIYKNDKRNLKGIIEKFVKKYPEYKMNPEKLYHLASQILEKSKKRGI